MSTTQEKIKVCNRLTELRLAEMPENHLFVFAKKQLNFIESKLQENGKMTSIDYDDVTIGMMCAKELENIDDEFCDAVYAMMTAIRPKKLRSLG